MKQTRIYGILTAVLAITALAAGRAEAHILDETVGGFSIGFLHPLGGVDHVLVMLGVGFWAAHLGGMARWGVPASFLAMMAAGGTAAMAGVTWPFVEAGIALSIAVLGGLIGVRVRMPVAFSMALVGGFALFHGLAHGLAAPAVPGAGYGFGFVAATAMLHGAGLGIGLAVIGKNTIGENTGLSGRWAGAGGGAIVATGLALMVL